MHIVPFEKVAALLTTIDAIDKVWWETSQVGQLKPGLLLRRAAMQWSKKPVISSIFQGKTETEITHMYLYKVILYPIGPHPKDCLPSHGYMARVMLS